MIDPGHDLPLTRQAELLEISRSNLYYLPRPVSQGDLVLMRRIDELHLNFPFAGARMLRDMLKLESFEIGRKHVRTLMDRMGITAIYRKRNTSAPHPEHEIYPYLLKDLTIDRPNHAWASDLTYIPMNRGFVYLVAIIDWASRRVLAHRVSISMTPDFCVEALEEAIAKYGPPEIFNSDQGSQFTSNDFTKVLKAHGIKISMDGKGRWVDKAHISHCTSFVGSGTTTTLRPRRRRESLVPCALRGESSPGGSYRHSFLAL
jgi:putative transposase